MPNWCDNSFSISGPKEKIEKIVVTFEDSDKEVFLETLAPIGKWDYNNAISEWGTKWEVSDMEYDFHIDGETGHLSGHFQSAWGPPDAAFNTFLNNNHDCTAELLYYEPSMDFAGSLDEGSITISDCSDHWFETDSLGQQLDNTFGIVEMRAEWMDEEETEALQTAENLEPIEKL